MTECTSQATFSFPLSSRIQVDFDGSQLTQDAGVLLLRQLDGQLGLTAALAGCLKDWRSPSLVSHSLHNLVRERVFAIAQGYEDCNDAAALRDEPLFKACCDHGAAGKPLASQPTLSRFEHQAGGVEAALFVFVRGFIERHAWKKDEAWTLTLDMDSTDDPTHGQQPFSFFHGYYDHACYQQLYLFTDRGDLLWASLAAGTCNMRLSGLLALQFVWAELKAAFPKLRLRLRADNGFACPALFDWCEDEGLEYVVNCGTAKPLCKQSAHWLARAEEWFVVNGQTAPVQVFGEFQYQAESWRGPRRVIAKAQRTLLGPDQRFVVTNMPLAPVEIYNFFAGRGQQENWIKDAKLGVNAGRLSCTTFEANQVRLLLFGVAYQLMHELRRRAPSEALQTAQLTTLRQRVLRVAAQVKLSARRLWVRIGRTYREQQEWCDLAQALGVVVTS